LYISDPAGLKSGSEVNSFNFVCRLVLSGPSFEGNNIFTAFSAEPALKSSWISSCVAPKSAFFAKCSAFSIVHGV
jgi:hypothetical protein